MKDNLLFILVFCFVGATAQNFQTVYEQLVYVNEQWKNQKDLDASLKVSAAKLLTEQELIQFHLQETEKLLRKRNVSALSTAQQKHRMNNLNTLHSYWVKGIFPVNDNHQNRQPYFIDKYNTYCAVGYLMQQSGADKMARDIHETQNYSYLYDINHPQLMSWTNESGLSLEELALIQPGYPGDWQAAIMEMHYNNTGTDVNEYIEVHESSAQLSGFLAVKKVLFFNDSLSIVPYKTLLVSQMQVYYYNTGHGGSVYWYTFPLNESFADSGRIILMGSIWANQSDTLEVTTYNKSSVNVKSYASNTYIYKNRTFQIGEDKNTPVGTSLTYCGQYDNNWSLQSIAATIGTANPCTILPTTLGNFSYTLINKTIRLNWETFSESNTKNFAIERSSDGINFTTIGNINAAGNSSDKKTYSFIDKNLRYINYYRIKQVDADGKFSYTKMLYIKVPQANPLEVLGNVVKGNLQIAIRLPQSEIASLQLYDFSGRMIQQFKATEGNQTLHFASFSAGSYLLQLVTKDGQVFNQRVLR